MRPVRSVGEDIRQAEFRSRSQEATLALLRTADELRRYAGSVLAEGGLTLQQYNVLRILRGAGPQGLATLTVGARMIERTPGVTRLIDRMESRGLVERRRDERDRRKVLCRITEEGVRLLDLLEGPVRRLDELPDRGTGRRRAGNAGRVTRSTPRGSPGLRLTALLPIW